jgi:hypothetical protein
LQNVRRLEQAEFNEYFKTLGVRARLSRYITVSVPSFTNVVRAINCKQAGNVPFPSGKYPRQANIVT